MAALDSGRIGISAQAVGIAQGCLDDVVGVRRAGTSSVDETLLADIHARTVAARLLTAHAARPRRRRPADDARGRPSPSCTRPTRVSPRRSPPSSCARRRAARDDHPSAIRLRDAKASQIYEGTNQVQRMVIARALLGG